MVWHAQIKKLLVFLKSILPKVYFKGKMGIFIQLWPYHGHFLLTMGKTFSGWFLPWYFDMKKMEWKFKVRSTCRGQNSWNGQNKPKMDKNGQNPILTKHYENISCIHYLHQVSWKNIDKCQHSGKLKYPKLNLLKN